MAGTSTEAGNIQDVPGVPVSKEVLKKQTAATKTYFEEDLLTRYRSQMKQLPIAKAEKNVRNKIMCH